MAIYTAQLAPVQSTARGKERVAEYVQVTMDAVNYSTAVAMASERAAALSAERGVEYGVVRVW